METNVGEALWRLESGYCLWVGAGLTRQIAAGHAEVPLWDQVTLELESAAGIESSDDKDYPRRLDQCFARLGENTFRAILRERYYTRLCEALLLQANLVVGAEDYIPPSVRAVAALGQLANPIVSFNIEPLSSLLLGRPAGPLRIVFQQPHGQPTYTWREPGGRFQRLLYHPHGLVTANTVMTAVQYEANSQTLAFQLAIHASFGNMLAIVGMSLDDEYLRQQIQRFRPSIGAIYWFNSAFSSELSSWAESHNITCVRSAWDEFWQHWGQLSIEFDRRQLAMAWYLAVSEAVEELEGGALGSLERSLAAPRAAQSPEGLRGLAKYLSAAGVQAGEIGQSRLIDGKMPRQIELALRDRLISDSIPLPSISKTYDPGLSSTGTV